MRSAFGDDWSDRLRTIYVGDDDTDEDAMQALRGMSFSFRVVNSKLTQTSANMRWEKLKLIELKTPCNTRLSSTDSVKCLLQWVEKHMTERRTNQEENF